jgi:hypothetical protein
MSVVDKFEREEVESYDGVTELIEEIITLTDLADSEFYSPIDIGLKIARLPLCKMKISNKYHKARLERKKCEIEMAPIRMKAEEEILKNRATQVKTKENPDGIRDKVGGQVTQQHIEDYVATYYPVKLQEYIDAKEDEKTIKDTFEILRTTSMEFKMLNDIAMEEWKESNRGDSDIDPDEVKGYNH